jgi:predicted lipoprotein with Yx(FWY)xxD motif
MRLSRLSAVAVLATALFAACAGADPSGTAAPTTRATATPVATAATVPTPVSTPSGTPASGEVTVQLANSEFGQILVDVDGFTLYGLQADEATGESTCYDDCQIAWPPLTITGAFTVGLGLDQTLFSTAERTDGTTQLKIGSYPLYYFAQDITPGETNGQGAGGVWFVVGADGELIRDE